MGATKKENFTAEQNTIAALIKALGHPARIAIVEHLIKVNACICGEIVSELPLAQATISQHLKELKQAGLVKGTVEGNAICYCVDDTAVEKLKNYFSAMASRLENKNNCC